MFTSAPFPDTATEAAKSVLTDVLREALRSPQNAPSDAVLAAGRLLRSGLPGHRLRAEVRTWLQVSVDGEALSLAAKHTANQGAQALALLRAWRENSDHARRAWHDAELDEVELLDAVDPDSEQPDRMHPDKPWSWWMIALRDDMESVRVALRFAAFGADPDDVRVYSSQQIEQAVSMFDRWAVPLSDALQVELSRQELPESLGWLRRMWQLENDVWWLQSARRAATLPLRAALNPATVLPQRPRSTQTGTLRRETRAGLATAVERLPTPKRVQAAAAGGVPVQDLRLEWQADEASGLRWSAWLLWPALGDRDAVRMRLENVPKTCVAVRWCGIELPIQVDDDCMASVVFSVDAVLKASQPDAHHKLTLVLEDAVAAPRA